MISNIVNIIKTTSYKQHLLFSFLLRLALIVYGDFHDKHFEVPYTDVDYKVFTDAARHVLERGSPYRRHTYRYTPLIAWMLTPNLLIHMSFGKILFSLIDIIAAVYIKKNVEHCMEKWLKTQQGGGDTLERSERSNFDIDVKSNLAMLVWLYNPITIGIATRGNSDSIAGCLVLFVLYLLQCKESYFLAGLIYGLVIHIRLYPVIYSLAIFLHLSNFSYLPNLQIAKIKSNKLEREKKTIFKRQYLLYLVPNMNQIKLIIGCMLSLSTLTVVFYYIYGYEFLYESYIYHLVRKDTRHNFSLYFYLQYITAGINVGLWQKVLMTLPQLVLIFALSVKYGLNRPCLNFAVFLLTCIIITYNSVLTSQYFVWILAVLPLCMWQINMSTRSALFLSSIWVLAQGLWLFSAYLLEFKGFNTFILIWLHSVSFFCANIAIIAKVISGFMYNNNNKEKLQ